VAIAVGYAAAFTVSGTPKWAPWLLALGIPVALGAIMILGATRGRSGIGALKIPFVFVVVVLIVGFGAPLVLPATEGPLSKLWLGLPARAAIVIYSVGLLPIIVLPVAYALTFETQTLSAEDVERVRALGTGRRAGGREGQVSNVGAGQTPVDKRRA
jgi:prepilin signal peptidase PulO-like enzyme (type II secretory pathway)